MPGTEAVALPAEARSGPVILCVEQFWREAGALYAQGWVHAGADRVGWMRVRGDDGAVAVERAPRPDLMPHYPAIPDEGASAGFSVMVPEHHGSALHAEVDVNGEIVAIALPLPGGMAAPALDDHDERMGAYRAFEDFTGWVGEGGRDVLEMGSRNVGVNTVGMRPRFPGAGRFVGMDIHPSEAVDVVGDAHALSRVVGRGSFDAVFSIAVLEHLAMPWIVAAEINRTLRAGGLTYHMTHQTWPVHETPNDFWRFTDEALKVLFGPAHGFEVVAAGMAERLKLYSHERTKTSAQLPFAPAYQSVYIVARKVAEIDQLAGDAETLAQRGRQYPV